MANVRREAGERGLPSLNQARGERRRALVLGRAKMPGIPVHFWLWTAVAMTAFGIVYWRVARGELESARSRVLAKQRAMSVALGKKLFPFRDQTEGWVRELSGKWPGNLTASGIDAEAVRRSPSTYLRLRLSSAKSATSIRKAVKTSLRDGFTSCLFVSDKAPDPRAGKSCRIGADCAPGELCNEWNTCVQPTQPYNLRLAYRTLRVLSDEWTEEVHQATSELGLLAYDRDLDSVAEHDVPVTLELITRARYFTVVLDEDPDAGLPAGLPDAGETPEERLQRVAHMARVGIWDLKTGTPVLRLRAEASGRFVQMGRRQPSGAESLAAQSRQVNNCQLALEVRAALPPTVQAKEPSGSP